MIRKIRPDAYLCRSSHFGVNDDDDNDRRTKRLLYPLLRMRARGNNLVSLAASLSTQGAGLYAIISAPDNETSSYATDTIAPVYIKATVRVAERLY